MIGIDIVDISRIKVIIDKHGARFLDRVFTETEIGYARGKRRMEEALAGRFAAKEAFMKANGTWLPWKEIEIQREDGRPFISFRGKRYNGLSISHERAFAVAVVTISGKE